MKFKLPIINEEFDSNTNTIKTTETFLDCEFNFSIDAQIVWEETFPELAKTIGLYDYVDKMKDVEIVDQASALIALKIIYCFCLFDKEMNFRQFVRLFTFSNLEYTQKICDLLSNILKSINDKNSDKKKD